MSEAKLIPDSIYPFRAERTIAGWPASRFKRQNTDIRVRRVSLDGVEQVQIEIGIIEFKGDGERMYRHSGSMVLDAAQTDVLISALQNVKVYKP
jgi:hypothetical protein